MDTAFGRLLKRFRRDAHLTQEALANYQNDNGLPISGAIDAQTLQALRLL